MICERCKIREANIKYMEVINGVKTEHNLCTQCAKEADFGAYSAIFDGDFPLGKLLSGLLGVEENSQKQEKMRHVICPVCGTSYDEFVKNSRFGCRECYGIFDPLIRENIKKLQGSDQHTGKCPLYQQTERTEDEPDKQKQGQQAPKTPEEEVLKLQAKLQDALRHEEYEVAAQCRDRIRDLKEGKEANA